MSFDPLFNLGNVFFRIFEVFPHILGLTAGYEIGWWWSAGLLMNRPATVLDTCGEVVGSTVGLGILEVQILCASWGVIGIVSNGLKLDPLTTTCISKSSQVQLTDACLSPLLHMHPYVEQSRGT